MTVDYLPKAILLNSYRGWIMEAIAKESAQAISFRPNYKYLPSSRSELFNLSVMKSLIQKDFSNSLILGYETYLRILKLGTVDEESCNLYFTHLNYAIDSNLLNQFSQILVMNSQLKLTMTSQGVHEGKIQVVYGAVDKEVFKPIKDYSSQKLGLPDNFILVSSDCKPRKNPEKILNLVRYMPDTNFVIHGKGWKTTFEKEFLELKNLNYFEFDYQIQPILMRTAAAFLSLSTLEGGPYSLIEALASGTPVVASRTGLSEDFLNSTNGFVVEHDSNLEEIALSLRKSVHLKIQVKGKDLTNRDVSWKTLGKSLYARKF